MLKILFPLILLTLSPNTKFYFPAQFFSLALISSSLLNNLNLKMIFPNLFLFDPMSISLMMLSLWVSSLMISVSLSAPSGSPLTTLTALLSLVLCLAFSMNNFLFFYITFELSLIPIILMILLLGYQPERIQAATYMLLYTVAASLPLFITIMILSASNLHLNLFFLSWQTPVAPKSAVWSAALTAAFMVKMPLYTTHLWLPKAHVEAPTAGSMILAALLLKLGSFGLFRVLSILPLTHTPIAPLIMSVGSWGAVLTTMVALRQTDFKALIAYSSVAHMSFMLAAILTMTTWGWMGAFIAMLTHGLCSSALFSLAGMTYDTSHTRSLILTKGQMNLFPNMTMWWFLFCASNMAAPPFMNLLSEIMIFSSVVKISLVFFFSILLSSFFSAAYNLHLYTSLNHGPTTPYMNPQSPILLNHHSSCFFHLAPLALLSLKPEMFMWW